MDHCSSPCLGSTQLQQQTIWEEHTTRDGNRGSLHNPCTIHKSRVVLVRHERWSSAPPSKKKKKKKRQMYLQAGIETAWPPNKMEHCHGWWSSFVLLASFLMKKPHLLTSLLLMHCYDACYSRRWISIEKKNPFNHINLSPGGTFTHTYNPTLVSYTPQAKSFTDIPCDY